MSNEGFEIVWANICTRYENKRILINSQLNILFNLQPIHSESGLAIKNLQGDINSCINTLKLYGIDVASWNPIVIYLCSNRLPDATLTLPDKSEIPKWSMLDSFLTSRCRTLESVSNIRQTSKPSDRNPKPLPKISSNSKRVSAFQTNVADPKCPLCPNESHVIRKCPRFIKMDVFQRLAEIKKQHLCLNCFSKAHAVKSCTSKHNCYKCTKRHNTLLHRGSTDSNTISSSDPLRPTPSNNSRLNPNSSPFSGNYNLQIQSTNSSSGVIQSCFSTNSGGVLLGTALVNICHLGMTYKARAFIDSGYEGTFISDRLFNVLKLPYKHTRAQISGLNNSISANVQKECSFVLGSPINNDVEISASALVVPHLAGSLPLQSISSSAFSNMPQMQLADPQFYNCSKIDILIGGDLFPSIMLSGVKRR